MRNEIKKKISNYCHYFDNYLFCTKVQDGKSYRFQDMCELIHCRSQALERALSCPPGKSLGLEFIPNQSNLFRNQYPSQSKPTQANPKKKFNLV